MVESARIQRPHEQRHIQTHTYIQQLSSPAAAVFRSRSSCSSCAAPARPAFLRKAVRVGPLLSVPSCSCSAHATWWREGRRTSRPVGYQQQPSSSSSAHATLRRRKPYTWSRRGRSSLRALRLAVPRNAYTSSCWVVAAAAPAPAPRTPPGGAKEGVHLVQ